MNKAQTQLTKQQNKEIAGIEPENIENREAALAEGLSYFKKQLGLADAKIGKLIKVPRSTVQNWISKGRVPLNEDGSLSNDAESLVHLLAIQRSLEAMFEKPEAELEWLNLNQEDLGGKPIEIMSHSTEDLILVRRYLDYMRGRGA
jgi:hypothetical protein